MQMTMPKVTCPKAGRPYLGHGDLANGMEAMATTPEVWWPSGMHVGYAIGVGTD